MERRIPASQLVRHLADILGRVRYGGDSFIVERHGTPIARIGPVAGAQRATLAEAAFVWMSGAPGDASFADDLERVGSADRAPRNPWAS